MRDIEREAETQAEGEASSLFCLQKPLFSISDRYLHWPVPCRPHWRTAARVLRAPRGDRGPVRRAGRPGNPGAAGKGAAPSPGPQRTFVGNLVLNHS
ncbi:unnamed protein product [Nyctereutes procyonoides]|uniref:(raccoon dog) hypothetical protein n=1 Tax=Nyctereutes procyonoides TaxID=34880 RepID=A0A811Z1Z9_NYCPR|nr:unnamed protein product [Nyctereutes procyonoides]